MSGTAAGASPFREVVHIDHVTGPRGGRAWLLTLSCGHHKAVPIPPFRPERGNYSRPPEAPGKCRCQLCEPEKTKKRKFAACDRSDDQ